MKKQMLSLFLALALTGCAAPGPGSTSAPAESGAAPAGSEAPASASQEESGYDRREAIERPEIGAELILKANKNGGLDNIAVVLVEIDNSEVGL